MRSKYEKLAQEELELQGWRVDNKAGMGRWSKNRDFWNLFDLVALKEGYPIRWISIKGRTKWAIKPMTDAIKEFWMPEGNVKELWYRVKKRRSKVRKLLTPEHWIKKTIK